MDIWTPEKRSEVMSANRSTGTKPELELQIIVRRALPRWKVQNHPTSLVGRPDLYLPSLRLAIFVEGCFWHACPQHGTVPKSNIDYWGPKLKANVVRDRRVERQLRRQGLSVWHVWEHDFRPARLGRTEARLSRRLKRRAAELKVRT
jgi:DNA mismatch endonuclease (patch repair protein)